jgi:hypothetical protein
MSYTASAVRGGTQADASSDRRWIVPDDRFDPGGSGHLSCEMPSRSRGLPAGRAGCSRIPR